MPAWLFDEQIPVLAKVGDLIVRYDKKTGDYCITQGLDFPIAERKGSENGQILTVDSKTLSGESLPRISCRFTYDPEGKPLRYLYSVMNADATFNRIYHDFDADGQLDAVDLFKDGKVIRYPLYDESVLEKISERDFPKEKHPASKRRADTPVAK
ncbi:MAG: hypothetical protein LBH00_05725 [Planctomycetaceae bacterium]|nr:hypothetical protein [Planctomycetaceae bacterium]